MNASATRVPAPRLPSTGGSPEHTQEVPDLSPQSDSGENTTTATQGTLGQPTTGEAHHTAQSRPHGVIHLTLPVPLPPARPVDRYELLQQFEGTVLAINGDEFSARLLDKTDPTSGSNVATFFLSDVSDADRALVAVGAVFYWSLGYRTRPWGQRERSQFLRFRRLPVWTPADLERAQRQADEWVKLFGADELR